jgi:transcription initiation factor TFIIH subunit 2
VREVVTEFVREFFDQNPISSLGSVVTYDGLAKKLGDPSANPRRQVEILSENYAATTGGGSMTLQSSLEVAAHSLSLIPSYGCKEIIVIHAAHSMCDPGDIFETIAELKKAHIRVSAIALPGEVYITAKLAKETGGTYAVPETREDFRNAMLAHCPPPPKRESDVDKHREHMVSMGFPTLLWDHPGLCACHKDYKAHGYECPRCHCRSCEVPSRCAACELQLVSAPALARSYHHLFPVPMFTEVPSATAPSVHPKVYDASSSCTGCLCALESDKSRMVCPDCRSAFCQECDALIHDTLHICPGCS